MKINKPQNKFHWIFTAGFLAALTLPILTIPPWFWPPDLGKTIIFRSIMAILLFLFIFQLLYKKNQVDLPDIKKNKIIWLLATLFTLFLLASIFSVDPHYSFWGSPSRAGGFINYAFYFIFAILAFFTFKKEQWKKLWIYSFGIGIIVSLLAIIQYFGLFSQIFISNNERPPSTIGNPIFLAMYILMLFFVALSFALNQPTISQKDKIKKGIYILTLLIFLYTILITGSRAAYLGLVVGFIFFLLFYPKKNKILKLTVVALLIFIAIAIFYVNTVDAFPNFIKHSNLFKLVEQRLSIRLVLIDPRFFAWAQIDSKIMLNRPLLGYGPENFSVGFDKYYNPSIPYLSIAWGDWWDRAHNILIQTASDAGIPAAIAYLALFIVLILQLQKAKSETEDRTTKMIIHGTQAMLIAYFTDNLFNIDSFVTWLLFFLVIGFSLHLTQNQQIADENKKYQESVKKWWKPLTITILAIMLIMFLWQYNLVPFQINTQINLTNNEANIGICERMLSKTGSLMNQPSILDSYLRMSYVDNLKKCLSKNPDKNLEYANIGLIALHEGVKIQPLYTRYWIYLGSFTTVLANNEQDAFKKQKLIEESYSYFAKAQELGPLHQEIFIGRAKTDMVAKDYQAMKQDSEKCISLYKNYGYCYWSKALAEIYLGELASAQTDMDIAEGNLDIKEMQIERKIDEQFISSLNDLTTAYAATGNYQKLANVYERLISIKPNIPQYHSSLAFTYSQIGQYQKAREQAAIFLTLMPSAKAEVNSFLKTLPY